MTSGHRVCRVRGDKSVGGSIGCRQVSRENDRVDSRWAKSRDAGQGKAGQRSTEGQGEECRV